MMWGHRLIILLLFFFYADLEWGLIKNIFIGFNKFNNMQATAVCRLLQVYKKILYVKAN